MPNDHEQKNTNNTSCRSQQNNENSRSFFKKTSISSILANSDESLSKGLAIGDSLSEVYLNTTTNKGASYRN